MPGRVEVECLEFVAGIGCVCSLRVLLFVFLSIGAVCVCSRWLALASSLVLPVSDRMDPGNWITVYAHHEEHVIASCGFELSNLGCAIVGHDSACP